MHLERHESDSRSISGGERDGGGTHQPYERLATPLAATMSLPLAALGLRVDDDDDADDLGGGRARGRQQQQQHSQTTITTKLDEVADKFDENSLVSSRQQVATITGKMAIIRIHSLDSIQSTDTTTNYTVKPTWKRYLILLLFALNSANKSYQWLQVPASTTKATILYEVDNYIINLASIIFMVAFIVLSWPACLIIENMGIRKAVVMAAMGTATGSTIKCFSCHHEGIWYMMIGQVLVSLSEQLIFSLPSRLASVWFPDHQVSLCVALCIVGGQIGLAMGFLVPQWFLNGMETRDEIALGFYHMFLATAIFSIAIFVICLVLFEDEPKHVPGEARLKQLRLEKKLVRERPSASLGEKMLKLFSHVAHLCRNRELMLLSTSYGLIVGIGYTIQTLLDQMLKPLWPEDDLVVGNTGFLIIVAGIVATPVWGRAMDMWHAFKFINTIIATGTLLSLMALSYAMACLHSSLAIYVAALLFGTFHTGFIVAGLEYAVELTYPAPELVTSSVMNLTPQLAGVLATLVGSYITDNHGIMATNIFYVCLLLIALVFLLFTRETLKRQEAITQMREKPRKRIHAHA